MAGVSSGKSVNAGETSNPSDIAKSPGTSVLNDRIEVHAIGEVVLKPDLYNFVVQLHSAKESVDAAKQSVQRRLEYIRHVLHNNHKLSQNAVQVDRDIMRTNQCAHVHCDIRVECTSARTAEDCRNSLVEKLDTSVKVLPIVCTCTPKAKERNRSQAFLKAVSNAKTKAEAVAASLGMTLHSPLSVKEHCCDETVGEVQEDVTMGTDNSSYIGEGCLSLRQRIQATTVSYMSSVTVVFTVQNRRKCRHRSCPKHSS